MALGGGITLSDLRRDYDAVFVGVGQGAVRGLGVDGEALAGVADAVDYIAGLRQAKDLSTLPVADTVVVIGGGNTAIDIAVQVRRLGAEEVTLVYRRGPEQMGATAREQEFARINGVRIRHWAKPVRICGADGHVAGVEFERTRLDGDGRLDGTGRRFALAAGMVFKAVGQALEPGPLLGRDGGVPEVADGRIVVDADGRTSLPDVWAGGDCVAGDDLTVTAVRDGRTAALAIDRHLTGRG